MPSMSNPASSSSSSSSSSSDGANPFIGPTILTKVNKDKLSEHARALVEIFERYPDRVKKSERGSFRWIKCKKYLRSGIQRAVLLFCEYEVGSGKFVRQFAAKCAIPEADEEELVEDAMYGLKNEIEALEVVQGAMHHTQLVRHKDGSLLRPNKIPPGTPEIQIVIRITEYLSNGALNQFLQRARSSRKPVPNRVLWMIFRCFIRACIGMAFPPGSAHPDGTLKKEWVPVGNTDNESKNFRLDDFHAGNVMFDEHLFVPVLKVIDYGFADLDAQPTRPDETAIRRNIDSIAAIMQELWTDFGRSTALPNLDRELYDLVGRCHAEFAPRPTLLELIDQAGTRGLPGKPFADRETNEDILEIMSELLLNADLS